MDCVNLIGTIILQMISEKRTGGVIIAREVFILLNSNVKNLTPAIFVSYERRPILGRT
jgi:hypothetical protein